MNLLKETLEVLNENGYSHTDVMWVGNRNFKTDWNGFEVVARQCEYNDGFGTQTVAHDLLIVGEGWWLERSEYDGSEWWRFMKPPIEPVKMVEFLTSVTISGWYESLDSINNLTTRLP